MASLGRTTVAGLERLLRPRSVAIVGASAEPGSIGGAVLGHLERCGYRGDIHLISRRSKAINGRPCLPSIDDLPDGGVISLFVEQIREPQLFLSLAERARSLRKPIVLLHPGRGMRARESARSH